MAIKCPPFSRDILMSKEDAFFAPVQFLFKLGNTKNESPTMEQ
jgi:hypothetical protein